MDFKTVFLLEWCELYEKLALFRTLWVQLVSKVCEKGKLRVFLNGWNFQTKLRIYSYVITAYAKGCNFFFVEKFKKKFNFYRVVKYLNNKLRNESEKLDF